MDGEKQKRNEPNYAEVGREDERPKKLKGRLIRSSVHHHPAIDIARDDSIRHVVKSLTSAVVKSPTAVASQICGGGEEELVK